MDFSVANCAGVKSACFDFRYTDLVIGGYPVVNHPDSTTLPLTFQFPANFSKTATPLD
jgi:hypothetical protein